jgi:hypothetical protein
VTKRTCAELTSRSGLPGECWSGSGAQQALASPALCTSCRPRHQQKSAVLRHTCQLDKLTAGLPPAPVSSHSSRSPSLALPASCVLLVVFWSLGKNLRSCVFPTPACVSVRLPGPANTPLWSVGCSGSALNCAHQGRNAHDCFARLCCQNRINGGGFVSKKDRIFFSTVRFSTSRKIKAGDSVCLNTTASRSRNASHIEGGLICEHYQ